MSALPSNLAPVRSVIEVLATFVRLIIELVLKSDADPVTWHMFSACAAFINTTAIVFSFQSIMERHYKPNKMLAVNRIDRIFRS
jgi:hypothetical protein